MSLTTALSSGIGALRVAQQGISVTSRNISNAGTPSFVRGEVVLSSLPVTGGVQVLEVRRVANDFLAAAALTANADAAAATARGLVLDQAQTAFGDPNEELSLFGRIDSAFTALAQLQSDPSSSILRSAAVTAVDSAVAAIEGVSAELLAIRQSTDSQIDATVGEINTLLEQIQFANREVVGSRANNTDPTPAENNRAALIDQLGQLVDIRVSEDPDSGVVTVRTEAGGFLVGFTRSQLTAGTAADGSAAISLVSEDGQSIPFNPLLRSGELAGLLEARNSDLPAFADGVASLALTFVEALNRETNLSTAVPAPQTLTGSVGGLVGAAPAGITGALTLAVTSSFSEITASASVDLTGLSLNDAILAINGAGVGVTAALNGAGQLTLSAPSGSGLVVGGAAADAQGRSFSQAFGLNDFIGFTTDPAAAAASGAPLGLAVRADILADPDRLPLARPDLVVGATLERGDGRGAQGLANARNTELPVAGTRLFAAATNSVAEFSTRLGAEVGRRSGAALAERDFAVALSSAADERRLGVEGVSLDEELVRLSQFQITFQSAARVVQAVDELFDVLINII